MAKLIVGVNDLATVNPELAKEWNYAKNAPLTPRDVTSGSKKVVWWKCQNQHEWRAVIVNRNKGNNCPYCAGQWVILGVNDLASVNPKLAKEWNYEKNESIPQEFKANSGIKVWWKCSKGHEWQAIIGNRNKGSDCPYCIGKLCIKGESDLATVNPTLVKEWNYEKNAPLTPSGVKSASNIKVWWKCSKGHEWRAVIANRNKGIGCPYCSGRLPIIGKTDLATVNPELAKEWNYEKNENTPQDYASFSNKEVWWLGKCGHEWKATIDSRNKGRGCPYCSNKKLLKGFNDLATRNPNLVLEWNYAKNEGDPTTYITGSNKKVWWRCVNNHEWYASICNRIRGRGCPYCSGSKTERLTYQILKDLNITFVREKKFKEDMYISFYPYDVWIASKKLLIELDGRQHFTDTIEYFEEDIPFEKRRNNDNLKNDYCRKKGIPILRIPYTYNPDTEKEKIKSMIRDFIETRKIPQEIIDFYEQYKENNNYAEIARKLNELN